jgi:hypothetical protein
MPPLIRRSQSAVPRHAGEDGGHSGIGPTRRPDMAPPCHSARPVDRQQDPVRELDALRGEPDEVRASLSEHIPLRRYREPEEIGWAAAFVLSPPRPTSPAR